MPKIRKVVATVWYNRQNMYELHRVFPDSEFVYVDFYDRARLAAQEACQWGAEDSDSWRGLFGRTAGIIGTGTGNNGRMLAERLHAMGMRLIACNRSPIPGLDYIDRKLTCTPPGTERRRLHDTQAHGCNS